MWLVWVLGVVVLAGAGFVATWLPRRRAQAAARRSAWSLAHAAIANASISWDAAPEPVPAAERLLQQAELLAARRGGPDAAASAADLARQADQLWRGADG